MPSLKSCAKNLSLKSAVIVNFPITVRAAQNVKAMQLIIAFIKPTLLVVYARISKNTRCCGTLRKEGATVIFAKGELYCYAVIFGKSRVIFASRVFGANIISLKLQVSISLCVITQNITVRPVSQYHLIFLFSRLVNFKICTPVSTF